MQTSRDRRIYRHNYRLSCRPNLLSLCFKCQGFVAEKYSWTNIITQKLQMWSWWNIHYLSSISPVSAIRNKVMSLCYFVFHVADDISGAATTDDNSSTRRCCRRWLDNHTPPPTSYSHLRTGLGRKVNNSFFPNLPWWWRLFWKVFFRLNRHYTMR